jgi:hypothetical protein
MATREGFYVIAGPEFQETADQLHIASDDLEDLLHKSLDSVVGPTILQVKFDAMDLRAYGPKHTGLRARLAAGVGVEEDAGYLRFTTAMPAGQEELPRGEDSGVEGWRHPVYGTDTWVHQTGGSWFREPIGEQQDEILKHMHDTLDQVASQIADVGHA